MSEAFYSSHKTLQFYGRHMRNMCCSIVKRQEKYTNIYINSYFLCTPTE